MSRPARQFARPALLLVQVLALTALMVVLGALLSRVMLDLVRVHRLAGEHADRIAVMDTLDKQLRHDLRTAERITINGDTLTLHIRGPAGSALLHYQFTPVTITRSVDPAPPDPFSGPAATEYRARRLRFAWQLEPAPHGGLLQLRFIEEPPPHRRLPDRTYSTALWLPAPLVETRP